MSHQTASLALAFCLIISQGTAIPFHSYSRGSPLDLSLIERRSDPKNIPNGVVCNTFLHPQIQSENLVPFLNYCGVDSDGFVSQTEFLCGDFKFSDNYTGEWTDHQPLPNDIRILQGLYNWTDLYGRADADDGISWDDMTKSDEPEGDNWTRSVAGEDLAARVSRVLDFGCGSGNDLTGLKYEFDLAREDCLCLDIFEVENENVLPILLNASSNEAYNQSLEAALLGREATVDIAISVVTFHHIPEHKMRRDALTFLYSIVSPGGIFLLRDWSNHYNPSLSIYFDLNHWLPSMLYHKGCPEKPEDLPQGTLYRTFQEYKEEMQSSGFIFDENRSSDPEHEANASDNPNRDFYAVFTNVVSP